MEPLLMILTVGLACSQKGLILNDQSLKNAIVDTASVSTSFEEKAGYSKTFLDVSNGVQQGKRIQNCNGDCYEDNDESFQATRLTPNNIGYHQNYKVSLDATINNYGSFPCPIQDRDFYWVTMLSNGKLAYKISGSDAICETLSVRIFNFQREDIVSESIRGMKIAPHELIQSPETINGMYVHNFEAGSYLIEINNNFEYKEPVSFPYHLDVSVEYPSQKSAKISELRYSKNVAALYRVSDMPIERYQSSVFAIEQPIGMVSDDGRLSTCQDPLIPNLYEKAKGKSIEDKTIFVWDKAIRGDLLFRFQKTYEAVKKLKKTDEEIRVEINKTAQIVDGVMRLAGTIVGLFVKGILASLAFDVGTDVFSKMVDSIFLSLLPENDATYDAVLQITSKICDILLFSENTSDREVIKISSRYSLVSTAKSNSEVSFSISYLDTLTSLEDNSHILYDGDQVQDAEEDAFFGGHLFAILKGSQESDLKPIDNLKDCIVFQPKDIESDRSYGIDPLNRGEYRWFKFVAKEAGVYSFSSNENVNGCCAMFNDAVSGQSDFGRLEYSETEGVDGGFYLDYRFAKGEIKYFRVHGRGWQKTEKSIAFVIKKGSAFHIHSFSFGCDFISEKEHQKKCWCGACKFEPHVLGGKTIRVGAKLYANCLECGGSIDINKNQGFVGI